MPAGIEISSKMPLKIKFPNEFCNIYPCIYRFCTLWDNQHQVYDHLEEPAKLNFRVRFSAYFSETATEDVL